MEALKELLGRVKFYIQITHVGDFARRYFVMNGFDGSMTALGVILGAWIAGVENPNVIVMTGLGACLAMGVSGFFSAYITERAERRRQFKNLEEAMLTDLKDSLYKNATTFASAFASLISGLSPSLTAIIPLAPFMLAITGILSIWIAYITSFLLTLGTLFSLGVYLGRIARENVFLYGVEMLAAGMVIVILLFLLGGLGG